MRALAHVLLLAVGLMGARAVDYTYPTTDFNDPSCFQTPVMFPDFNAFTLLTQFARVQGSAASLGIPANCMAAFISIASCLNDLSVQEGCCSIACSTALAPLVANGCLEVLLQASCYSLANPQILDGVPINQLTIYLNNTYRRCVAGDWAYCSAPEQSPVEAPMQAPEQAPVRAPRQSPVQAPVEAPEREPTKAPGVMTPPSGNDGAEPVDLIMGMLNQLLDGVGTLCRAGDGSLGVDLIEHVNAPMAKMPPGMGKMPPMANMGKMPPMANMGSMPPMADMGKMPPMASMGKMPPMADMGKMPPMADMGKMPPMASMGKMPPMGSMPPVMPDNNALLSLLVSLLPEGFPLPPNMDEMLQSLGDEEVVNGILASLEDPAVVDALLENINSMDLPECLIQAPAPIVLMPPGGQGGKMPPSSNGGKSPPAGKNSPPPKKKGSPPPKRKKSPPPKNKKSPPPKNKKRN